MNPPAAISSSVIYYRLVALWVLCEAMLGAIIFTFRIPISGLVIGGCAVICISLIAWYNPKKGMILQATVIVAIFKMLLSPQAPPPAYIAVFFQGLMGELLFWNRKYFRFFCVLLAIITMMESAFQRIITLTIIYGNDFWKVINESISKLTGSSELTDYSYFIILWYILIHLLAGFFIGMWMGFLPYRIRTMRGFHEKYAIDVSGATTPFPQKKKRKKLRLFLWITWLILLALYIQSFFRFGEPILPSSTALRILIRSVIIILTWYFLVSPVLKHLLHKWLQRKKQQSAEQVSQVLDLLPSTQGLIARSWQLSSERKGWKRIMLCLKIILANTFYTPNA